ncbi:hypothetical protein RB595_010549 [Gaeumannomyces hyphopodioides]
MHLRLKVRPTINGETVSICLNTGSGRTLVDRDFLDLFPERTIEKRRSRPVRGAFGGDLIKLNELATFWLYAPGTKANGAPGVVRKKVEAWVTEGLEAGCLLGTQWQDARNISINFNKQVVHFPGEDFSIPFAPLQKSVPVVRKVVASQKIKLLPGELSYVPVSYVDLPRGRSFALTGVHPATVNAILNSDSHKVILLSNPTDEPLEIKKHTRLGTIHEQIDRAHFVSTGKKAFAALALATMAGQAAPSAPTSAEAIQMVGPNNLRVPLTPSTFAHGKAPMNSEFVITPEMREELQKEAPAHTQEPSLTQSTQPTPMPDGNVSDYVWNIVKGKGNSVPPVQSDFDDAPEETDGEDLKLPEVPKVKDRHGYGIKTPDKAPYITTQDGVRVYNGKPKEARILQRICKSFAKVWIDKGPIDVPKDMQMRVPLAEGYQKANLASKAYPVSKKNRDFVDGKRDELHAQGRMEWVHEPSPFAQPVFVVWRKVHNEMKGRVVVDLRPVNKVAVPDAYPLPLQADVIDALRGKLYITIIDATAFFHQFLVWPKHRNRFTIVSHRGLERSLVAMMGFKNSPAYAQRFMDTLLRAYRHFARAFIDDIVIFSDTFEEHTEHLTLIFKLFLSKNIALSPPKAFVGFPSVELLGFYVDALGLLTTAERIQGFQGLEFPRTLKALETYLGSTGFLRAMISYYAQRVEPLQKRKVELLAKGRREGKLPPNNPGKRQHYTRSREFEPTAKEKLAFEDMQAYITKELRLHHQDPDRVPFLQIDGSLEHGFGVMFFHHVGDWIPGSPIASTSVEPIMFLSRCLSAPEQNYGPSELEVGCLVWAVRRLRTHIHSSNRNTVVLTDHEATKGILAQTSLKTVSTDRANRRLVNTSVYLSAYPLDVYHMPGKLNLVPDALSRLAAVGDEEAKARDEEPALDADAVWNINGSSRHDCVLAVAEAVMSDEMRDRFRAGYKSDPVWARMIEDLTNNKQHEDVLNASKAGHPFRLVDGLLYNRDNDGSERLVVPTAEVLTVLRDAHDDRHHFSRTRMMQSLEGIHFRRKRHLVDEYVAKCHACGGVRINNQKPPGSLQPIQAPEEPIRLITMDFVTALPTVSSIGTPWALGSEGKYAAYDAFLTVTCKSSKRSMVLPGNERYTASDWGTVLGRHLLLGDWACPKAIISDRDAKFVSDFWTGMWKTFGTKLQMTTAYHPQADGQSERKNQVVEMAIRYHAFENPDSDWADLIPALQWNLNNAYTEPIEASPHEYLFGFKMQGPLDRLTGNTPKSLRDMRYMREHLRRDAQLASDIAAAQSKRIYDAKHRQVEFEVGDKVWLELGKAYKLKGRQNKKEAPRRQGPYDIVRKVSPLAYELDFKKSDLQSRLHPVVSIQYLTKYNCDDDPFHRKPPAPGPVEYTPSDEDSDADSPSYEVERVVTHGLYGRNKRPRYLVRWKGYGEAEDT